MILFIEYSHQSPLTYAAMQGNFIYTLFARQCNEHLTQEEYRKSFEILHRVLGMESTKAILSDSCIHRIRSFANTLRAKEYKLANYIRRFTYLSMDAMTTSPVEGNNNAIKHGQFRIHSNMNLSQSLPKVYGGVNSRIERSISQAKRDTGKTSYSSRAATADFVNVKGQSLVDRNFDSRFKYKGAQTDTETWKVWCFDSKRHNTFLSEPWCYLPYYHRVHNLEVRRSGEKLFIHCSCGFYHRTGLPCPHFFFLIDEIDLMMIHVRYWKVYHAYFNEDSDIGRYLTRAQAQLFENRTCGIPIMSCHLSVSTY